MSERPVAFFDIDGTVFRSSLLIEVVEALVAEDVFPLEAREGYLVERQAWEARSGSYEAYIAAVVESFKQHIKGVHYGTLADIGRAVVARESRRVYRYTRDLLADLKSDGYYLVAISHSPKTVVDSFCANYGFDKVYGHIYEIGPSDCFTGAQTESYLLENKANIVRRVLDRETGLTRTGSVAVGDTRADIPMLELVEQPTCFNPNQALYEHAQRMRWPVVVERKDVVYEL